MNHQIHTIIASNLVSLRNNPQFSDLSLYGSNGGTSLIIGEVRKVNAMLDTTKADMISVETEHGTVWIEADKKIHVLEDLV